MSERVGVRVYIGWEGAADEWELGEVEATSLDDLPSRVFGLFEGSTTPVAGVTGHLVYDETANHPVIFRLELERP